MESQLVESNGEFCFDLFREMTHSNVEANVFFSPFSILSALAMVYLGATGETASQLRKSLHFEQFTDLELPKLPRCQNPTSVHTALQRLLARLRAPDAQYALKIASRLYVEDSYPILQKYSVCTWELYRTGVKKVYFQKHSDTAIWAINNWVDKQTNGLIQDLVSDGSITSGTITALVNVIYFKGKWEHPFREESTTEMPFMVNEGVTQSVQMMHKTSDYNFASIKESEIQILELPYANNEMSMIVLLPNDNFGLPQLQNLINYETLLKWMKAMSKRSVEVYLPRMKMEEKYSLTGILQNLGITDLFTPTASLSGISSEGGLSVSEIIHKSYVEVNEEGTEAAAATGTDDILTASSAAEPVVFKADHPFLFCIIHENANLILFWGKFSLP